MLYVIYMCPRQVKTRNNLLIRGVVRYNVRRSLVVCGCQANSTDVHFCSHSHMYINYFTMALIVAKYWFYIVF